MHKIRTPYRKLCEGLLEDEDDRDIEDARDNPSTQPCSVQPAGPVQKQGKLPATSSSTNIW